MTLRDGLPYRRCVGIMVLNDRGLVWTGRRIVRKESETGSAPQLWQMPQGGIDEGEEPASAALRELYEETGIRSVELIEEAPDWFDYDLPDELVGKALKGRYRGQTQRWFAYRFTGNESEIAVDPPPDGHVAEFDAWQWRSMDELPDLIVPFKRDLYRDVVAHFSYLSGKSTNADTD